MNELRFQQEVEGRLLGLVHLLPVFSSVWQVPQRLREYDPDLYVVINTIRHLQRARGEKPQPPPQGVLPIWGAWYEVHSLAQPPDRDLVKSVRYGALDARILREVWQDDLRQRGDRVFREVDEHNARVEAEAQRALQNDAAAIARETHRAFARAAWGDGGKTLFGLH